MVRVIIPTEPDRPETKTDTGAPQQPAAYPGGALDAITALTHLVSRSDLVRVDADGKPSEKAVVIVEGKIFEDWESVWIYWGWAEQFSQFRFTCAERDAYPSQGDVLQFAPGNNVEIFLGGILVITGTIMTRQVAYDGNQHLVQLQGYSHTWYANRSSIEHKTSDFNGKGFIEIADAVLSPTGVGFEVMGDISPEPFKSGATNSPGEPIGQFLERLARERKVIVSNLPNGKYLFVGEHQMPLLGELVEGVNIKKMQCIISMEGSYSDYLVRGQSKGGDDQHGRRASEQEARVKGVLPRYSMLITAMEHPVWKPGEVIKRAENEKMWNDEMTAFDVNVTVYGWFRPLPTVVRSWAVQQIGPNVGHTLWQAGDEVTVHSPMAMLNKKTLKIRSVTWTQDNINGTQTLLNLRLPRSLDGGPPIPRDERGQAVTTPPITPEPATGRRPGGGV